MKGQRRDIMGGEYKDYVSSKNKDDLEAEFNNKRKEDKHDYGHSGYSGSFAEKEGLTIHDDIFDCKHDAEEWISGNNDKWGDADAVRFREGDNILYLIGGVCSC